MNKNNVDALVEKRENTQPPTVECSQGSVIINIGNKKKLRACYIITVDYRELDQRGNIEY